MGSPPARVSAQLLEPLPQRVELGLQTVVFGDAVLRARGVVVQLGVGEPRLDLLEPRLAPLDVALDALALAFAALALALRGAVAVRRARGRGRRGARRRLRGDGRLRRLPRRRGCRR